MAPSLRQPRTWFSGSFSIMFILALLSGAAYAKVWTFGFALLLMLSMLVHEMGHVWAMWQFGLRVRGVYAIPFLGAATVLKDQAQRTMDHVVFALMGPAWGLALAAIIFLVQHWIGGDPLYAAVAYWMAAFNLLNLYPAIPLDGGQVWLAILSPMPKPARIVLVASPLAFLVYITSRYDLSWPVWTMVGGILFVNGLAVGILLWQRADKRRVMRALIAEFFRGDAEYIETIDGPMLSDHIGLLLVEVRTAMQRNERHVLFDDRTEIEDYLLVFLENLTHVARSARSFRGLKLFGKDINVTSRKELVALNIQPFSESPLGEYLSADSRRWNLTPIQSVTALIALFLLAFAMMSLMWLASDVPGAMKVFVHFGRA